MAPNLTLYRKLLRDFGDVGYEQYVFRGLAEYVTHPPVVITGDNYESARTGQTRLFGPEGIELNVFNTSKFHSDTKVSARKGAVALLRMKRLSEYLGHSYYDYLASLPDLVVLMDEAHRYYADASRRAIDDLDISDTNTFACICAQSQCS